MSPDTEGGHTGAYLSVVETVLFEETPPPLKMYFDYLCRAQSYDPAEFRGLEYETFTLNWRALATESPG